MICLQKFGTSFGQPIRNFRYADHSIWMTAIVTWAHVWMAPQDAILSHSFWGIKIQGFPGGGIGWQGIVPRKAVKYPGLSLTKLYPSLARSMSFSKPCTLKSGRFYQPNHEPKLDLLIDEIMNERSATLWANLPLLSNAVSMRMDNEQLPAIMKNLVPDLT